jgi:shikimate kinase
MRKSVPKPMRAPRAFSVLEQARLIILMGMKHCGKTTLGRMLARLRGEAFIDLDEFAEGFASRREGRPLTMREVYRAGGKEAFQALEAEALRKIAADFSGKKSALVLALGGGTIENSSGLAALGREGVFVFLDQDEDVLFARIAASGIPPFLAGDDPRAAFHRVYETRTALYREKADLTVNMRGKNPEEALDDLASRRELYRGG